MLGRQKKKDNYIYAGNDLPTAEAQKTHIELENARQLMITNTVEANLKDLQQRVRNTAAYDENDQPITDESGRQLSLGEVSERSLLKSNEKTLDKIIGEIRKIKEESDLTKVKKDLDKFNLDNLAPLQVQEIYATIDRIQSEIIQKKAAAKFIEEQALTERVKRTGEVIMNGLKAKDYDNYESDKWWRRGSNAAQPILNAVGMAIKR